MKVNTEHYTKLCPVSAEQEHSFNQMKSVIQRDNVKAVSFNIFDTLIMTPFLYPTDLFFMLEKDFSEVSVSKKSFSQVRTEAEAEVRRKNDNSEADLSAIYEEIQKKGDISPSSAQKLMEREKELMLYFCYPRECGLELFREALNSGKKVVLVSESCLPKELIIKILNKCGVSGYKSIFLSNMEHTGKSDGKIYTHIAKKLKLNSYNILHIGSDVQLDVEVPINAEMMSLYVPNCRELFFKSGRMCGYIYAQLGKKINTEKYFPVRCLMALYAEYAFDYPSTAPTQGDFCQNYYYMGFAVLGGLYMYDNFNPKDEIESMIISAMRENQQIADGERDFIEIYQRRFRDFLKKFSFEGCNLPFSLLVNHGDIADREFFSEKYDAVAYEKWNERISEPVIAGAVKNPVKNSAKPKKKNIFETLFPEGSLQKKLLDKINHRK